jgi:[acyl-carrier-protein] S-malonyltransferase
MQQAVPVGEGAMAAMLTNDFAMVTEVCAEAARETGLVVVAANLNSPGQTVISGAAAAVERASAIAKAKGVRRVVMLSVSAPFHCALMQPAQEVVAQVLESIPFADPAIPVAANVTGQFVTSAESAREALVRQVTSAVRWIDCVQTLIGAGPTAFIEVGPGKVLSGLLRQIDPGQKALNVEDAASLEKTLAELQS